MQNFPFNYEAIPEYMRPGLLRYVNSGVPPGGFLYAVIEGDLHAACGKADDQNMRLLPVYSAWLYNRAPAGCFGFKGAVDDWVKIGGLNVQDYILLDEGAFKS